MPNTLLTTTGDFLYARATLAMKEGAEQTIKKAVEDFEKTVRDRVYDEVSKLALNYVETMTADPLERHLKIVIEDRRGKDETVRR